MRLWNALSASSLCIVAFVLAGCASVPKVQASVTPGGEPLSIAASDFRFDPNVIAVHGLGAIMLKITNSGGTAHNITVDTPSGKAIKSVEIPPHSMISTHVVFDGPGDYNFFCSHPFHADLGMKGHFLVLEK